MLDPEDSLRLVLNVTNNALDDIKQLILNEKIEAEYKQYFTDNKFETIEELVISLVSYYDEKLIELVNIQQPDLGFGMIGTLNLYVNNVRNHITQQVETFLAITKSVGMVKITDYEDINYNTGWIFLDVESIGLNGESFAFAYEVVNRMQRVIDKGFYYYHPRSVLGTSDNRKWIMNNCFPTFDDPKTMDIKVEVDGIHPLLNAFKKVWAKYNKRYGKIVADCPYPCESNFLFLCNLDPSPIPIYDIATMLSMVGKDPVKTYSRLPEESPAHSPVCDCLQSKRLFFAILHGKYDEIK